MARGKFPIFIYLIVSLAIIGLVSSLIRNPSSFLMSIFVMIGIAFVVFLIVNAIVNKRSHGTSDEMKKYRKAVKQSKLKYSRSNEQVKQNNIPVKVKQKKKRKRLAHLTVIDGKKAREKKNNDRASN